MTSHVISPEIAEYVLKTTVLDIPSKLVIKKLIMIFIIAKIIVTNISLTLDIQIPPSFYIFMIEESQITRIRFVGVLS